jgi:hypothetical protein
LPCAETFLLLLFFILCLPAELNVAFAAYEGAADYLTACLVWLQGGGKRSLSALASQLKVTKIADLTMARVYPKPPPAGGPPLPNPKPRLPPPRPLPR